MSQHTVILECPEMHLRPIDGAPWMVTTTDVSAKYFSADEVSQIDPGVSSTSSGFVDGVSWRAFAPNYREIFVDVHVNCIPAECDWQCYLDWYSDLVKAYGTKGQVSMSI